ncbi:MAG TPA: hypothetical protein VFZ58_05330 [Candidatus Saccharimonadales bacterium]
MNNEPTELTVRRKLTLNEILPADEGVLLKREIAAFAEKHHLHPQLAEALQPENALIFATGLPESDTQLMREYVLGIGLAMQFFDQASDAWLAGNAPPVDHGCDDQAGRLRRGLPERMMNEAGVHQKRFYDTLKVSAEWGVRQSKAIEFIIERLRTVAFHAFEGCTPSAKLTLSGQDSLLLTGMPKSIVGVAELSRQLEEIGLSDLSEEALDKRLEHFTAIAQFESVRFLLHDWFDYARLIGLKRTEMKGVYERIVELLHANTLPDKLLFLKETESFFKKTNKISTDFVSLMSQRIGGFVTGIENIINDFKSVYEYKGFTLPAAADFEKADTSGTLENFSYDDARRQLNLAQEVKRGKQDRLRQQREAQKEDFRLRCISLKEQVDAAEKPWKLPSKIRKQMELADFYKCLLQGFKTSSSEYIKVDIPDDEALAMVGILVRLDQLATSALEKTNNLAGAQAQLEAALQLHQMFEAQRNELYETARSVKDINLPPVELLPLQANVDRVRSQWPAFEKLLREKWPTDGTLAALRIKELLAID